MSGINRIPWWVWPIPAALLVIATSHLPYGYYTFLRIVVCGFAGLVAFISWEDNTISRIWSVAFVMMAVLFNPFVPVYLNRATWFYLDIGAAIVIVAHLMAVRVKSKRPI
jgi:hypothetical protein